MQWIEDLFTKYPSLKRAVVGAMAVGLIAGNKKLNLGLTDDACLGIATLAVGYILQSGLKSAAQAHADGVKAAAGVKTLPDAAAELSKPGAP